MSDASDIYLIHAEEGTRLGPIEGSKGDLTFPAVVRGWSDVLDCRHHPYDHKNVEELRRYAQFINKRYILVPESTLGSPS